MNAWTLEASLLDLVADAALLGGALIAATLLRRQTGFLQRYLIPNSLVAGCIGLVLGPEILSWLPLSVDRMGAYVYHLLALTFICVGLKGSSGGRSFAAIHLGFMQVMCLLLQGIIGLSVILSFYYFVDPSASPAAGILLPLGFAMGPGVAYSIGASWAAFGFPEGASVGLTLAAVGFLVAYFVGVIIVHRSGVSSGELPESVRTGFRRPEERTPAGLLTLSPAAVEPLALHIAVVAAIYGSSFLLALGLAELLELVGRPQEIPVVWSFHFILANLVALVARQLLDRSRFDALLDHGLLDRMTGVMADFLIAASIMAISIGLAWSYALPIVVMAIAGAAATYFSLKIAARLIFSEYRFERFVGMFGEMTGTVTSGLALIRILDPEYRSPVAQDLVLSSGVALGLAFPLLATINLPFTLFDGRTEGFLVLLGIMTAYLGVIMGAWWLYFQRPAETNPSL
jgi:glutamate:Na+ symporter, ESS family